MARGIQLGQRAADAEAIAMDAGLKAAARQAYIELAIPGLTIQHKLKQDQIPGNIGSCAPDGLLWLYKGKLIAAFEAKKQGTIGNALERWFCNNYICRLIAPNISYITFCCGEGALPGGTMERILNIAHLQGFNKLIINSNSCFMQRHTFAKQTMIKLIKEAIILSIYAKN